LIDSRQKGKRGEREAAKYLRSLGFTSARRGVQYCGGCDSPDVVCNELPGVHIEVKYSVKGLDLGTEALANACIQARTDCGHGSWAVLWKPMRAHQWRLTFIAHIINSRVTVDRDTDIKWALQRLVPVTCSNKEAA
jgi:Holliday junction resolvase